MIRTCRRPIGALALVIATSACDPGASSGATESVILSTIDGVVPVLPDGTTPRWADSVVPQVAAGAAAAGPAQAAAGAEPASRGRSPRPPLPPSTPPDPPGAARPVSPLAELVRPIGSAVYDAGDHVVAAAPSTISIPQLGVDAEPIIPVGVMEGGELDVPDPRIVGWYRGSPVPGAPGAAVLAAHVNFDGVPGVFRHLRDLDGGEVVTIGYDDGTMQTFEVTAVELYDKDELPEERVWAKDGDPTLVLFTCGGRFNRAQRSYEDNVVAFARPVP